MEPIRYTLGKHDRLKSRKSIEQLFKMGKSVAIFPFRVLYQSGQLINEDAYSSATISPHSLRAGFTVSNRNFKKAVDRNRIRRLMKEAYRLQKHSLQQATEINKCHISLFIIYTGKELPEYILITEKMKAVLKKLIQLINGQA